MRFVILFGTSFGRWYQNENSFSLKYLPESSNSAASSLGGKYTFGDLGITSFALGIT